MSIAEIAATLSASSGGGIEPTGTIEITENGIHDVTQYAQANVNVPQPSGLKVMTANGNTDVTDYAEAVVHVRSYKLIRMTVTDNRTATGSSGSSVTMVVPNLDSVAGDLHGGFNPMYAVEDHSIPVLSYYRNGHTAEDQERYRGTYLYVFDCSVTAATGMRLVNDPATEGYYQYELDGVDCSITIADKQ